MSWRWELRGNRESVRTAREVVRGLLSDPTRRSEPDLLLVVSELVTNAIVHTAGPVQLSLSLTDGRARVEVGDPSPDPPVKRSPDRRAGSGRGIVIVDRLARSWGWSPRPEGGKVVWCEVDLARPGTSGAPM